MSQKRAMKEAKRARKAAARHARSVENERTRPEREARRRAEAAALAEHRKREAAEAAERQRIAWQIEDYRRNPHCGHGAHRPAWERRQRHDDRDRAVRWRARGHGAPAAWWLIAAAMGF